MNYLHAYHAGNAADVHKHLVLCALVQAMQKKDKPFCYIDTHAGEGLYNLYSARMKKTKEAKFGILGWYAKFSQIPEKFQHSACISQYISTLSKIVLLDKKEQEKKSSDTTFFYPGSPYLAALWARESDICINNEGYFSTYQKLKSHLKNLPHPTHVHNRDAYEFLKAIMPAPLPRAFILIDPSYEALAEEKLIFQAIKTAYERFPMGVFAIWYPVKGLRNPIHSIIRWLQTKSIEHLTAEWRWSELTSENIGLNGTGMLIINPPWQIEKELKNIKEFLQFLIK